MYMQHARRLIDIGVYKERTRTRIFYPQVTLQVQEQPSSAYGTCTYTFYIYGPLEITMVVLCTR